MISAAYSPLFFRFDCGCIGTAPDSGGHSIIVKACDYTDDEYCFMQRGGFDTKKAKHLTLTEHAKVVEELSKLIIDGYKLRRVKRLLG
jgi:hypothetical protein